MRELTPQELQELERKWGKHYFSRLSPEDIAGIPLEKRLAGITLPEVFRHFKPEEIKDCLKSLKQKIDFIKQMIDF